MSTRARDAFGRPVPVGSPDAVEGVPADAVPPDEAVRLARELVADGRPFFAHEVLEASWKAAAEAERPFWQGLAQLCVGLTHLQRDNRVGAARLLRRGAGRLVGVSSRYDVDVPGVIEDAVALAAQVESGQGRAPQRLF